MGATSDLIPAHIEALHINGYRPFRQFRLDQLVRLNLVVGANGSGKSSLFEFLRFLRDGMSHEIPPEIVSGAVGQQVFHRPGPDAFTWRLHVYLPTYQHVSYVGEVQGPVGQPRVTLEQAMTVVQSQGRRLNPDPSLSDADQGLLMQLRVGSGRVQGREVVLGKPNLLCLGTIQNVREATLYALRSFIAGWRFYCGFNVNTGKLRGPVTLEQEPNLHEDCGNLSSVLFFLANEHSKQFDELKAHLRLVIPRFADLSVRARGRGQVLAYWKEQGIEDEFSLADMPDGVLRFLCWTVLSLAPTPPSLLCIDEPELGIHPRALSVLAGSLQAASYRAPILLSTHSSYFLTFFDLEHIAVMKKTNTGSVLLRAGDSAALQANLDDFGNAELEAMHRSDELEALV